MSRTLTKAAIYSFASALFSFWVAWRYFYEVRQMAACALTALGLASLLSELLEANRKAIWQDKISPWRANHKLAAEFTAIFTGIFCAALVLEILYGSKQQPINLDQIYRNQFIELLSHNMAILLTASILAIVYRAGGLVMILAWNASHWAEAVFSYLMQIQQQSGVSTAALIFSAILPHLILEALSYLVAGLAGVFISIALFKYQLGSSELRRVSIASLTLVLVAICILFLATSSEIYLAQNVFHFLLNTELY